MLVGHNKAAEELIQRLTVSDFCTTGFTFITCIPRHLGSAAVMLGRLDEAKTHYQDALKVASDMRFRPKIALTRFQMAELLLERYPDERDEALEHFDFAREEFREMKMQPYIEKAQVLEDSL